LFVNISVGGTLTHFAAPPVLMVAGPWNWGMGHMVVTFGWKALLGIIISNGVYYALFRRELARLQESYVLRSIKEEIRLKYLNRRELDAEFEKIASSVDKEIGFRQIFEQQIEKIMPQIKQRLADRLSEKYLPSLVRKASIRTWYEKHLTGDLRKSSCRKCANLCPVCCPRMNAPNFRIRNGTSATIRCRPG